MKTSHLREHIVRPTLQYLGLWSRSAENLLLGTAAQESRMGHYLVQVRGPALGIYQIEPTTHEDIYNSYLNYKDELREKVIHFLAMNISSEKNLVFNLAYSTAICRIVYYRIPVSLPKYNDVDGLAQYWKKYYNTPLGRGTVTEFVNNYNKYIKE